MSERLKNQKFREGLVILLLGIALGVYSLYQFYTAAVKTSWIMSPYLFPLLLSAFTVLVSLSLLLEAVHELRAAAKEDGKGKMNLKNVAVVMLPVESNLFTGSSGLHICQHAVSGGADLVSG